MAPALRFNRVTLLSNAGDHHFIGPPLDIFGPLLPAFRPLLHVFRPLPDFLSPVAQLGAVKRRFTVPVASVSTRDREDFTHRAGIPAEHVHGFAPPLDFITIHGQFTLDARSIFAPQHQLNFFHAFIVSPHAFILGHDRHVVRAIRYVNRHWHD